MRQTLGRTAVAVAAALAVRAAWDARKRRRLLADRFGPRGRFVRLCDGSRIHLTETGDSDAPAVILIHGSDGVLGNFSHTIVDELSEGLRVVAVDRPGHGWSTIGKNTRVGVESNVEALREALLRLGIRRAVLVGHSYGGAVALRWALRYPQEVCGLVLLSPAAFFTWPRLSSALMRSPNIPFIGPALSRLLLPVLGRPALAVLSSRVGFRGNPVPPEFVELSHAFYLRPSQFSAFSHEYARFRRDVSDMEQRYAEIRVPTHILSGADDPLTTPSLQATPLATAIPGSRLTILPNLAHEIPWHASPQIVDAIRQVVAETWH